MSTRRYFVTRDGRERSVEVAGSAAAGFTARVEGREEPVRIELLGSGSALAFTADGRVLELFREPDGGWTARPAGQRLKVSTRRAAAGGPERAGAGGGTLRAPMPGRVVKLLVAEGDTVAAGAGVVVVEAMKMENELAAPRAGVVRRLAVKTGDTVERDAVLLELE